MGLIKDPMEKKNKSSISHPPPKSRGFYPNSSPIVGWCGKNATGIWASSGHCIPVLRSPTTGFQNPSLVFLPAHFLFTFSTYLERLESKLPKFAHWWDKPCWLFFLVIRTCLTRGNPCSSATNYLSPLRQALPHREEGTRTLLKAVSSECASKHICWTDSDLFQRLCVWTEKNKK